MVSRDATIQPRSYCHIAALKSAKNAAKAAPLHAGIGKGVERLGKAAQRAIHLTKPKAGRGHCLLPKQSREWMSGCVRSGSLGAAVGCRHYLVTLATGRAFIGRCASSGISDRFPYLEKAVVPHQ